MSVAPDKAFESSLPQYLSECFQTLLHLHGRHCDCTASLVRVHASYGLPTSDIKLLYQANELPEHGPAAEHALAGAYMFSGWVAVVLQTAVCLICGLLAQQGYMPTHCTMPCLHDTAAKSGWSGNTFSFQRIAGCRLHYNSQSNCSCHASANLLCQVISLSELSM